ncbi:hypothetical protein ACFQZC_35260 [Streptacidiphilus monticola]
MLTGRPVHGDDTWFARGDGTLLPVSWLVSPCRWDDGTAGTLVVFHEVPRPSRRGPWARSPSWNGSRSSRRPRPR